MKNFKKSADMLTKISTMSLRIEPKLRYLAEIAARESDCSLTRYLESAAIDALRVGDSPHLLNEGLWDESPAMRLYMLVTAKPHLLKESERLLWKRIAAMPELLNKARAVDRHKLAAHWSRITKIEEV